MSVKGSIQDASLSGAQARSATNNNLSVQEPISNEMGNNIRDSNVVDWESPDDPDNPMNWPATKKWTNIVILSFLTLITPLASSILAPGVPEIMEEFGSSSPTSATLVVSIYVLGFAIGPLVLAPLSETYGRLPVYNIGNFIFTVFNVACGLSASMEMLIGFRFLAGCFGTAPIVNGGGTIADIMPPEKRGGAMAVWAIGPLLGPVLGPIIGAFITQREGWRWAFWTIAIIAGIASIVAFFLTNETYAPVLLERKVNRLRKATGINSFHSTLQLDITPAERWRRSLLRPMKLMFFSIICALMSLYMAIVYGILYLLFTTFTFVFEERYGFSQSIVGLVYIGLGVGNMLGLAVLAVFSDTVMQRLANKHSNGIVKPEHRLPMLIYSGPVIPVGIFLYGWTVAYQVHWIVPLVGTACIGFGLIMAFMCINTYLVDAYTRYAASAIAATTVLRSIFGCVFPLFGLQMYKALGLGWGNSLLGFLSLALCPIPLLFYWYGETLRKRAEHQVQL